MGKMVKLDSGLAVNLAWVESVYKGDNEGETIISLGGGYCTTQHTVKITFDEVIKLLNAY
ncbi:MAG: hypothetical protein V1901_04105 [Patescibacteria group bacterium]